MDILALNEHPASLRQLHNMSLIEYDFSVFHQCVNQDACWQTVEAFKNEPAVVLRSFDSLLFNRPRRRLDLLKFDQFANDSFGC